MNKKGMDVTMFEVAFGLIIAAILSVILINIGGKFLAENGKSEKSQNSFYFLKLADNLLAMNEGDKINPNFLTKKDKILLAFNKDSEIIKINELNNCIDYKLSEDIKKPVKCRDKNCLCNCNADLSFIKDELNVDCDALDVVCVQMPLSINSDSSCRNFMIYDKAEKLYDLEAKKENNNFLINY